MIKFFGKKSALFASAALAALGSAFGAAATQQSYWVSSPATGSSYTSNIYYIDFQASSPGRDFPTWTPPNTSTTPVKYAYFQYFTTTTGTATECYDVQTYKGGAVTSNADTRIWLWDASTSSIKSISDDYNSTYYSRARIWAKQNQMFAFSVSPFSDVHANIDFMFWVRRLNYTTANDCQTLGLPATVNFVNTTVTPWNFQLPNG